jgi:hypothetical protein
VPHFGQGLGRFDAEAVEEEIVLVLVLGAEFFGGYKTKDLMADLNLSESAIRRLVRQGVLERVGNRITEESLIRLCRERPEVIPFETLSPCHQNWLVNSLHYGRKIRRQRGGRKRKDPPRTDD